MRTILLIGTFIIYSLGYCQDRSGIRYAFRSSEYIEKKWQYFTFTDTIKAKIIQHLPAKTFCGTAATASMSIVELDNGELIRILDLCNIYDFYKPNQYIKITNFEKPNFNVVLPFLFEKKPNKKIPESISKDYDLRILKTTYVTIH